MPLHDMNGRKFRINDRPRSLVTRPHRLNVGLHGAITWEKVNRRGEVTGRGQQSNLFLDQGLNLFATYAGTLMITYLAVGTGSTEPDVTQVALVSELARTATAATGGSAIRSYIDQGEYAYEKTCEFTYAQANGNLTEWGISPTSSGNLIARELFRDEFGDPVTITKTSDEILRVAYRLTMSCAPITPYNVSFAVTGIGTLSGVAGLCTSGTNGYDAYVVESMAKGTVGVWASNSFYAWILAGDWTPGYNNIPSFGGLNSSSAFRQWDPMGTYASGSYKRRAGFFLGSGDKNYLHTGYAAGQFVNPSVRPGWYFRFDDVDRINKTDFYTLSVDLLEVNWDRMSASSS